MAERRSLECHCPACTPLPRESYTPEFREAAEARHVAGLTSDNDRARYLAGVREKRGKAAYERLRQDAWAVMQKAIGEPVA